MHACLHGGEMLDKIVMHIPVDASLVDIDSEGRYCVFGFDVVYVALQVLLCPPTSAAPPKE